MIAYFPSFYPDELLYSRLARFYQKSGLMAYSYAARELFENPLDRPDFEFINRYAPAAIALLTRDMSMEEIVTGHTLFPYFARFLPKERRERAFQAFMDMRKDYHNHIAYPKFKNGMQRSARYCPMCVKEDRQRYGETYWHRQHQIIGVDICPLHGCGLVDTDLSISSKMTPSLITAEEAAGGEVDPVICTDLTEMRLARYVASVFAAPMDMSSDVDVSVFLHNRMAGTPYLSVRGRKRDMAALHRDFRAYYETLQGNWFTEEWQIQKLLNGQRMNMFEVCLLALFLGVPAAELTKMTLPAVSLHRAYDERIFALHRQGLNYREIAAVIGGGYDTVKAIGEGRYT